MLSDERIEQLELEVKVLRANNKGLKDKIDEQSKEIEELKDESKEYQIGFAQGCYEKDLDWKDKIKAKIEEVEQWELYNMKIPRLSTLDERLGAKIGIKYVLQSLLEKELPTTITKEELEKRWKE